MPDLIQTSVEIPEVSQTPPPIPTPIQTPSRRLQPPTKNNTGLILLTLFFAIIGAISGGFSTYLYWQSQQELVVPTPSPEILNEVERVDGVDFVRFNDHDLPLLTELGVNNYDLAAFQEEDGIISYPDAQLGIDVSQYQGDIDWEAVADSGVTFAIIRLGYRGYGEEGNILLDQKFHQNMEGAKAAGLDVGVYFFSQATSVWESVEEAYFVIEHLEDYELDLPVVFDWEFISHNTTARTHGVSGKSLTLFTQAFCGELEMAGYDCMVYFNQNLGYLHLELDKLADYPFWLASYRSSPNFHYHFDIWQYSDTGRIDGINAPVDLNLMFAK